VIGRVIHANNAEIVGDNLLIEVGDHKRGARGFASSSLPSRSESSHRPLRHLTASGSHMQKDRT
jgi:hypothetical protein